MERCCYNSGVKETSDLRLMELRAGAEDAGERLDRFVAVRCTELSRTRVKELIEAEKILVNGKAAKGATKLRGGEVIRVQAEERPALRAEAEDVPLQVLYEDEDVLVVNKPAGMTVHAGAGLARGTLVNALLGRGQSLSRSGDALRPGIVHRLDKETSGAIVIAKNDFAHARLAEAFRAREVEKTYIALVEGELGESRGRIELAIARDPKRRVRMTARRTAALSRSRHARTDWTRLLTIGPTTLVEVQLHTGRTHQIRVHFSATHHPVVGDALYGGSAKLRVGKTSMPALERNFLHAARLAFAQPRTGNEIRVTAPLPGDLHEYLRRLGAEAEVEPGRIDGVLTSFL